MEADLGQYFDIKNIKDNFKQLPAKLFYTKKEVGPSPPLQGKRR